VVSLSDLVRSSLRLRPDRIPIGEVRGAEALDLLKAWGTGHPGGLRNTSSSGDQRALKVIGSGSAILQPCACAWATCEAM
jgi:Flp pilus assembly CpaF family ATPase